MEWLASLDTPYYPQQKLSWDGFDCMDETRELDVYWTVQNGQRCSIALSEEAARDTLPSLAAFNKNPDEWTIERTREIVPLSLGEIVEGEGEVFVMDKDDCSVTLKQHYKSVHVFWHCPLCRDTHNCDLYGDPVNQTRPEPNPSIWFCEKDKGIVLVHWRDKNGCDPLQG